MAHKKITYAKKLLPEFQRKLLQGMPPKEPDHFSETEMLNGLAPALIKLAERGYPLQEIAVKASSVMGNTVSTRAISLAIAKHCREAKKSTESSSEKG